MAQAVPRGGMEGLRTQKRGRPVTKKDDRHQAPKSSEPLDAPAREALENRIKELEAENEILTIQKRYLEELRSLVREEKMKKGEDRRQTPRTIPTN